MYYYSSFKYMTKVKYVYYPNYITMKKKYVSWPIVQGKDILKTMPVVQSKWIYSIIYVWIINLLQFNKHQTSCWSPLYLSGLCWECPISNKIQFGSIKHFKDSISFLSLKVICIFLVDKANEGFTILIAQVVVKCVA